MFSLAGFLWLSGSASSAVRLPTDGARAGVAVIGMILTGLGLAAASLARTLPEVLCRPRAWRRFRRRLCVRAGGGRRAALVCDKRRGFASGLAVSGIGVGTLVMPPLAAQMIEGLGWRTAYLVLGGFAAIVDAGMALLIENDPRDRGLAPDGDRPQPAAQVARLGGTSVGDAIRSRRFIGLYAACLVCGLRGVRAVRPSLSLMRWTTACRRRRRRVAAGSAIGVGSTAGRFFLGGALPDRMGTAVKSRC